MYFCLPFYLFLSLFFLSLQLSIYLFLYIYLDFSLFSKPKNINPVCFTLLNCILFTFRVIVNAWQVHYVLNNWTSWVAYLIFFFFMLWKEYFSVYPYIRLTIKVCIYVNKVFRNTFSRKTFLINQDICNIMLSITSTEI